ncbi:hypothetical protein LTR36_004968 [Oleoguttula mirabilis]|uniref:Methyltransferase type 12 domain-containing protein n=1 Tax=Oleoguttula mirabilis TaxID=1507867 RepID=A0AAV9JVX9_9PEZI|nr:hypothetical protein LTR36_004968 [Oleoguttula mirabilis]
MASTTTPQWDPEAFWKEQNFQTSARYQLFDTVSRSGLHLQHWIWNYQLGYVVHPKIDVDVNMPLRIADVACGNGAWIFDVSRTHPQHEYHGFDITASHFPASGWLPSNVHLHTWDAFTNAPPEFNGTFDIVHIRTISSAIIDNRVDTLLQNLLRLLKPGGYLQWDENDLSTLAAHAAPGEESVVASSMRTMVALQTLFAQHQGKILFDWLHELPESLKSNGCEVLAHDSVGPRPELSRAWSDNTLTVWMSMIAMLPEQEIPLPPIPGLPKSISRQSFADLVRKAAEESSKGACVNMEQIVVVARKAT